MLVTPGIVLSGYVQVFQDIPKAKLGYSVLRDFFPYTYGKEPPDLVGADFFRDPFTHANASWLADGYANFGYPGMIAATVVLILLLWAIDDATRGLPRRFACLAFLMPGSGARRVGDPHRAAHARFHRRDHPLRARAARRLAEQETGGRPCARRRAARSTATATHRPTSSGRRRSRTTRPRSRRPSPRRTATPSRHLPVLGAVATDPSPALTPSGPPTAPAHADATATRRSRAPAALRTSG